MSSAPAKDKSNTTGRRIPSGRRLKRVFLLGVIPFVFTLVGLALYLMGGRYVETDNAYVKADKIPISAEVSGMIQEVLVKENQDVIAGQPLFRINAVPFQIAVARARAKLAQVRTDLETMKASYREKQAEITLERTKYAFAVKEQKRQADLLGKKFISAAKYDEAEQNTRLASQQIDILEQDLKRLAESLGGSVDMAIEKHPRYLAALAELEQARVDLTHTEVKAPFAGTVSNPPKTGQYASAGSMAMVLVVSSHLWVEANFPETDLTYMHQGQPVEIRIDTYPGVSWKGTVESLSPATGAEFSVIPAQNATGNWVKIAQRVPVRIRLEDEPGMPLLRTGLSAIVEIDTGHRRRVFGFSL
jgi:membrane fusion protein, multidrug efflux system